MNEFKKIMQGWRNLCKSHKDCDSCPMHATSSQCTPVDHLTDAAIGDIEEVALQESSVWIPDRTPLELVFICSKCGGKATWEYKYCPECGSRMTEHRRGV